MKVYTVNGESARPVMSEVFSAFDCMEEKTKDYILKQYESIGNLHKILNDINEYVAEMITNFFRKKNNAYNGEVTRHCHRQITVRPFNI